MPGLSKFPNIYQTCLHSSKTATMFELNNDGMLPLLDWRLYGSVGGAGGEYWTEAPHGHILCYLYIVRYLFLHSEKIAICYN